MVHTIDLRPKGFPKFMGTDFFLAGYRLFVKYTNNAGNRLRGLYILKSETDKRRMEFLGNMFTHYNYTTTDIGKSNENGYRILKSIKSNLKVEIDDSAEDILLPVNSPFAHWKEARRFAGPLPFTFTYNAENKKVLIIEGVRENWIPKPLKVISYNVGFLQTLNIINPVLANAFIIEDIPYHWKKGNTEQWIK